MEQTQCVPMQRGQDPHRRVGEPVQLFQTERATVERAQHGAPAFGAEIKRQVALAHGISMTTLPTPPAYSASISNASGVFSRGKRCVTIWSLIRPDSISSSAP